MNATVRRPLAAIAVYALLSSLFPSAGRAQTGAVLTAAPSTVPVGATVTFTFRVPGGFSAGVAVLRATIDFNDSTTGLIPMAASGNELIGTITHAYAQPRIYTALAQLGTANARATVTVVGAGPTPTPPPTPSPPPTPAPPTPAPTLAPSAAPGGQPNLLGQSLTWADGSTSVTVRAGGPAPAAMAAEDGGATMNTVPIAVLRAASIEPVAPGASS